MFVPSICQRIVSHTKRLGPKNVSSGKLSRNFYYFVPSKTNVSGTTLTPPPFEAPFNIVTDFSIMAAVAVCHFYS